MLCRPIMLHNEFVPAMIGERNWDYQVLGSYDGITVCESFDIPWEFDFKKIFDICLKHEGEMHPYFTQFLFAFSENTEKENKFWKADFPYLYIVQLQFFEKEIGKYKMYLDTDRIFGEEVMHLCYYMLDNSDLLLAIKSKKCETGAKIINDLYQNKEGIHPFSIRNSYSLFGIKKDYIEEKEAAYWGEEIIPTLEARVVEKCAESVGGLCNVLEKQIKKENKQSQVRRLELLGTEDEVVLIKNVKSKDLISLYKNTTGLLCNSNGCSQKYANAISVNLLWELEFGQDYEMENNDDFSGEILLCDLMNKELEKIYNNKTDIERRTQRKNLMMLINALKRFELSGKREGGFTDYIFFTMLFPCYIFIKLLGESKGASSAFYYEYMKTMKLCTQNFIKPDRVYAQTVDFNMRYFDVPVKLITIYNAYVYYFKNRLNTTPDRKYEFLICPGVNNEIEVEEIFTRFSSTERLMKIEIPEQHMYNPQAMFVALGHEMAHFVGRDNRLRESRFESILQICSHIVIIAIKTYAQVDAKINVDVLSDAQWKAMEQKAEKWLRFYVGRTQDLAYLKNNYYYKGVGEETIQKNFDFNNQYYWHTDVLQKLLVNGIEDMLLNRGMILFGDLIEAEFQNNAEKVGYEEREVYYEKKVKMLQEYMLCFLREYEGASKSSFTLTKTIGQIMYLIRECYADLICILTLELKFSEYLEAFVTVLESADISSCDIVEDILLARIAIVFSVMNQRSKVVEDDSFYYWKKMEADQDFSEQALDLKKNALIFQTTYIRGAVSIAPKEMIGNVENIIYDKELLTETMRYLLRCRDMFYKLEVTHPKEKETEQIRKFYRIMQSNNANEFFEEVMGLLEDYKKDVYSDIEKIVINNNGTRENL